ncbi:hypothetical protein OAory_01045300 [Aspergillus oryzae]|uniref:Uncharacterized protein n=1 Tax=Aspergillus oryzae TaxID=5062 RepID=A0A1S9DG49_ASPOZ|nr:hypothetical protein OAory_01045300 [Aspergillus oryzae]
MDANRNVQAQGGGRGGRGGHRGAIKKLVLTRRIRYAFGERGHNYRNCPLMAGHMALNHLHQNTQPRAQPQPEPQPQDQQEDEEDVLEDDLVMND